MSQYNLDGTEVYNQDGQTVADIVEISGEITNALLEIFPNMTVRVKASGKEGRVVAIGKKGMVQLDIEDLDLFGRTVYHISELEVE
jgi:hypothetical protein